MKKGCIGDMSDIGVVESYKVKRHVVTSAEEAAEMILRVDDIVQAAPRLVLLISRFGQSPPSLSIFIMFVRRNG